MKRAVLILCTGNSCRSQMAEGIINHFLGDSWQAYSAGTKPSTVNPRAIEAMAEIGIDISHHRSKHVDEFDGRALDLVITVCGSADRNCPVWIGKERKVHIPFDDPYEATGSEEEIMAVFRRVRNEIREQIVSFLQSLEREYES